MTGRKRKTNSNWWLAKKVAFGGWYCTEKDEKDPGGRGGHCTLKSRREMNARAGENKYQKGIGFILSLKTCCKIRVEINTTQLGG